MVDKWSIKPNGIFANLLSLVIWNHMEGIKTELIARKNKMKKVIISLVLTMMSVAGYAQNVVGKWVTEGGDSQVEIYQSGDKLNGKIVWLKKGDGQLDVHNPDKKLQSRKLVGVNILTGLTKKGEKWEGGKIYNPKNGKTYKCSIWLEGNNLKVRGYVAMFYETQTWTKK